MKIFKWIGKFLNDLFEVKEANYQSLLDSFNKEQEYRKALNTIKEAGELMKKSNNSGDPFLRNLYREESRKKRAEFDLIQLNLENKYGK